MTNGILDKGKNITINIVSINDDDTKTQCRRQEMWVVEYKSWLR